MARQFVEGCNGKILRVRGRFGGNKHKTFVDDFGRVNRHDAASSMDFADSQEDPFDNDVDLGVDSEIDGYDEFDYRYDNDYDFDFELFEDTWEPGMRHDSDYAEHLDALDAERLHCADLRVSRRTGTISASEMNPSDDDLRRLRWVTGFRAKAGLTCLLAQPVAYIQNFYGDDDED